MSVYLPFKSRLKMLLFWPVVFIIGVLWPLVALFAKEYDESGEARGE